MNHGRERGQLVMMRAGPGRRETVWLDSARLNFNNAMPTTETDLQPSSVKSLSSNQTLVQFRSLHKSTSDRRQRGRQQPLASHFKTNLYEISIICSLLVLTPCSYALFLTFPFLSSACVIFPTVFLPSAFYYMDWTPMKENKPCRVAKEQACSPLFHFPTLSLTSVSFSLPLLSLFCLAKELLYFLRQWKPTAAGRSEIITTASVTNLIGSCTIEE